MGNEKLKVARTDTNNLVSNLRGEVGEVVTTWLLMQHFLNESTRLRSGDIKKDMDNRHLLLVNLLEEKLRDELVGRLSELAEEKVGQLTFYFASRKLDCFSDHAQAFSQYIIKQRIREKRNRDVSHKQLPEQWADHDYLAIPYKVLIRAVALALRLMKRIDRHVLGPSAPYLWREARKRRYTYVSPPRAGYMLIPYLRLSDEDRVQVLRQELEEGTEVWSEVPTSINGQATTVLACKKWGIVALGDQLLALKQYPLISLESLVTAPENVKVRGEGC